MVVELKQYVKPVALVSWRTYKRAAGQHRISSLESSNEPIKLMIGAGPNSLDGWIGTDFTPPPGSDALYLDATKRFPFSDGTVSRIHSEHMIEHIDHRSGQAMLNECFRVTMPGGQIRIATPDFDVFARLAHAAATHTPLDDDQARYVRGSNERNGTDPRDLDNATIAVNRMFSGHGHRCLYSAELLSESLRRAGFVDCTVHAVGQSDDPVFIDVEQHGKRTDDFANAFQTLVVEADKPVVL